MITCTMLMVFFIGDKTRSFESSIFKISTDELTDYIYLNPKTGDYDTTVIFLDSDIRENNRFVKAFAAGKLTSNRTRIIFPQSEGVYKTKNGNQQWYSIKKMPSFFDPKEIGRYINQDDLYETAEKIVQLIKSETNEYFDQNPKRIILGGYG